LYYYYYYYYYYYRLNSVLMHQNTQIQNTLERLPYRGF